ncbi:hypothetical protein Btru_062477 [Bulinus truncatus]|nr:hypothetical protein Btru_062477 [Bulinus truncatus]
MEICISNLKYRSLAPFTERASTWGKDVSYVGPRTTRAVCVSVVREYRSTDVSPQHLLPGWSTAPYAFDCFPAAHHTRSVGWTRETFLGRIWQQSCLGKFTIMWCMSHVTVMVLLQATKVISFSDIVLTFEDLLKENNIKQFTQVTGKSYIYVGGMLNLTCMVSPSFTDQGYNSSQIRFLKEKKTFKHDEETECLDMQYIHVINTSTAQLVIQNVTEQEAAAYSCLLETCNSIMMSSSSSIPGVSHDIKIQCTHETASNLHQKSWKICGLKPFTSHNFSIVCQAKYFSDPSNYSYTTPQKAPLSGPEAMNGSYISEECTQESVNRNVTLFWKDVKETEKNGIIKRIIIKYKNIEMSVEKEKYFTTLNLPCNSQETVKLFAENDAGHSLNPTMLTIAPHFFKVPQEMKNSFSVELTNASSVQAIWQNDDYNNSKRFTVFWLEDFVDGSIKGPVYWKHVPKNHTSISLSLTKPLLFKVGLVISDDNLGWTSPIEWTDCFYEPSSLPTIVEIDVRPSQESVIIIWEKIECNKLNKEDIKTLQISPAESSYILTQLIPNTSYKLAAYARAGDKKGPMSEWKQFSTKEKYNGLLYLCILLIIPFSAVICPCIITCYKGRKRIQKFNSNHETCSEPVMKSTTIAEMQTEYCELSNLATDSASPLLNPSDIRPQKSGQFFDDGGETSVLLKDLIQRDVHSDTKYSTAISIVENSMASSKEVCANERKCKAPDSNNKLEECSDYIKVNELHELDYLTNVLVEDDIPGTVLSETLHKAQSAQTL